MNRNSINVGKKIKTYRKAKKYTLKNLAEKTGLSIGFLSQLERGMTTIAIDSLFNLANVLDVDIMDFLTRRQSPVMTRWCTATADRC